MAELEALAHSLDMAVLAEVHNKVQKQDKKLVTFVKPFRKEDCKIDWTKTSREIFNFGKNQGG